ncbi:MAG: hypothetical protein N2595_02685 [bacterium]|nr:hypothetical protein [bacterium]
MRILRILFPLAEHRATCGCPAPQLPGVTPDALERAGIEQDVASRAAERCVLRGIRRCWKQLWRVVASG